MDNWLIDKVFEPFSHKLQRLCGINNFMLAKISLLLSLICWLLLFFIYSPSLGKFSISCSFFILLHIIFYKGINCVEKKYFDNDYLKSRKNSEQIEGYIYRLISLFIFIGAPIYYIYEIRKTGIEISMLIERGTHFFLILALYFLSCTPIPPATSKFKKWLKSLFLTPIPVKVKS